MFDVATIQVLNFDGKRPTKICIIRRIGKEKMNTGYHLIRLPEYYHKNITNKCYQDNHKSQHDT